MPQNVYVFETKDKCIRILILMKIIQIQRKTTKKLVQDKEDLPEQHKTTRLAPAPRGAPADAKTPICLLTVPTTTDEEIQAHIKDTISKTRGPLGHLLDTAIRCLRAKWVGITTAEKMAVEKLVSLFF